MFPKYDVFRDHFTSAVLQNSTADNREKEKKVWVYLYAVRLEVKCLPASQDSCNDTVLSCFPSLHETNDACLWTNERVFLWAPAGLWEMSLGSHPRENTARI